MRMTLYCLVLNRLAFTLLFFNNNFYINIFKIYFITTSAISYLVSIVLADEEPQVILRDCTIVFVPVPAAARSKTWVCGRSLPGIVGSNPAEHGCLSFESVACCQIEVSAMS